MWLLVASLAIASVFDLPFDRVDDRLRVRRYKDVSGDGPAWGRVRASYGAIEAWVFPDGSIEHYRRWRGSALVEEVRYSAVGTPFTTTAWADGTPSTVTVHGAALGAIDVSGWSPVAVGAWTLTAPSPEPTLDGFRFAVGGASGRVAYVPGDADVFDDDFGRGFQSTCGCVLEDRRTEWLDGRAAARYRYRPITNGPDQLGELWAASDPEGIVVVLVTGPPATTAYGRAVVALARRER